MEPGKITLSAQRQDGLLTVFVEDSAGLYQPKPDSDGLGMNLVDRRIKLRYGDAFGLQVTCERDHFTRVAISVPVNVGPGPC